jgi:L-2,4-diaminobutyrate decarboxylase
MTPDEIWNAAHAVVDRLRDDRMAANPRIFAIASREEAANIRRLAVPDGPRSLHDVIDDAVEIFSRRARMDHPRCYGFIPSPASPLSVLGDLLTSGFNAHAGSWLQSSGPSAIEHGLVSWLAEQAGLPEGAGGLFVSGGSMANLTGLMVARDRMLPPDERQRGVAYVSTQTHFSVLKGLGVLGFLPGQVRKVEVDARRRLDPVLLAQAIAADRAAGLLPFAVVASCGTTNTGSIDDLNAIADLAAREQLWMHVDGAYGASIVLSNRHRALADGLGRADSLSWDAHKWLFQTYGCGMVLVRDRRHLIESFANSAEYLQDAIADQQTPNFWDYGIELTRPARAMKLWLTLQVMGRHALGDAIDHGVMLAEELEAQLRKLPDWSIVSAAQLGIVTFRYAPADRDVQSLDALNTAISRRMVEENIGAPLTTKLDGQVVLRACTISPAASVDDIRLMALEMDAVARQVNRSRN